MLPKATILLALLVVGCVAAPMPASPASRAPPRIAAITGCTSGCWEPTLTIDAIGRLFVVAGEEEKMATSMDGGHTFTPVRMPPLPPDVPANTVRSDQLVQADPQGRLYYAAFLGVPAGLIPPPLGLQVATSTDGGATWATNEFLSITKDPASGVETPFRMWLGFAADGTAYLDFNQRPGQGVWLGRSDDHGKTWQPFVRVQPQEDRILSSFFSPPVVAPDGRILIAYFGDQHPNPDSNPFYFQGEELRVAISQDKGRSFTQSIVKAAATGEAVGTAFPSLAVSAAGELFVGWWDNHAIQLSTSSDSGKTWTAPVEWTSSQGAQGGPWIDARDGHPAVLYFAANGQTADLTLASAPRVGVKIATGSGTTGDFPYFVRDAAGRVVTAIGTSNQTTDVIWSAEAITPIAP